MKRLITLSLCLMITALSFAYDFKVDGIYYNITSLSEPYTVEVTKWGNYSDAITIPATVYNNSDGKTYSVTSIGNSAFYDCTGLTSITIPNSVTSIGEEAFGYCSGLTSVTIPNSVTSIGSSAFYRCSGLTSVTIPNSVTSIGSRAFYDCSGLTSVTIPNSVTYIGMDAFSGTAWYDNQPDGLVYAGKVAYKYKGKMPANTSITLDEGTLGIAGGAFYRCTGLTSVTIPNSVTSIGNEAFYHCGGLTSVTIPNSVTSIGQEVFSGCSGLTSITIPNSVTSIGSYAFYNCGGLTSVTIPNSVTSIGSDTFGYCSGLTSVTIPNSVTSIGFRAFGYCSGLTSVTIPNSVTSIGDLAFEYCSGLTSLTIPNSVTRIGGYAFYYCKGLTSVTIPNSVTYFGSGAFSYCSGLTSITIPNSVTSIGAYAFSDCSGLASVTIPNSVTYISMDAFSGTAWYNNQPDGLVYAGKVAYKYKGTMPANTSITLDEGTLGIAGSAFSGCSGLTSVTIPNSVTNIGGDAFDGTTWYNNQPDGMVYAGKVAYKYKGTMPANTSITLDEGTLGIAGSAFYDCSGLTSVTIPNSVTSIGYSAFYNCRGMTEITSNIQEPFATDDCWYRVDKSIPLYVPAGTKEEYQSTNGWKDFTNIIEMNGPYVVGDISGDNVVDVSDYTGIANFIHGNPPAGFNEKAADVDENGTIDVSDYTGIANIIHTGSIYGNSSNSARATGNQPTADWDAKDNVIFIAPFTATAGTKTSISFEMKNTAAIRGFQFDLYLPEGMTVVKSAKGKIQGKLSEGRLPDEDEHDLTFSQQADGAIRFLCSSQYDETFTGTSGELATLQVEIASDMANGDHAIQLKNMKLTETDISKYYTSDLIESTVTIEGGATTGIIAIAIDQLTNANEAGAWYTIDGRRLTSRPAKAGLYIKNGKKVVIE